MKLVKSAIAVLLLCISISSFAHNSADNILENNKKIVIEFMQQAFNQKDFSAAAKYIGPKYIQHSPKVADGIEGFKKYIEFIRKKFPNTHVKVIRVFAEKDYAILQAHFVLEPNTRGYASMDIFRLNKAKIVEHWSVFQAIPEKSANSNSIF